MATEISNLPLVTVFEAFQWCDLNLKASQSPDLQIVRSESASQAPNRHFWAKTAMSLRIDLRDPLQLYQRCDCQNHPTFWWEC